MGDALERHIAGLETLAVQDEFAAAVRFYAELGGQSSQVRPPTARVLAGSGAKDGPVNSGA